MKNIIAVFLISLCLLSCSAQDGKVIEVQETTAGKFVVVGEREADTSYVIVKYLNGQEKTMTFDQAEQFINTNPPSAPTSQVFNNYDGGHNQGGITFSDLILYHMMFGGFGGNSYHTHIVERYPSYYQNIHPTNTVNYPSYRRNKESEFASSKSRGWKESKPSPQAQKSTFKAKKTENWTATKPKEQKPVATKSSYTSKPSSSWGSSSSNNNSSSTKSTYASKPSPVRSSSSSKSSSWGGSSKSSSFGSRKK